MPFVATFFVRETQNFASLQADAIVVTDGKLHDGMLSKLKQRRKILRLTSNDSLFVWAMECLSLLCFLLVRRKILRLYWGGFAIYWGDGMPFVAALFVRETQNFASLLG